ncbi:MAG TPA: hypothetical protein VLL77_02170 [Anaerolineales bacterium]|nr:hypothetical protein [Anaerolineales bacterium]
MGREVGLEEIRRELSQAERSRRNGQEGRARVCARRAAGWTIGRFYRSTTGDDPPSSALTLLRWYRDLPEAPGPLRAAAGRLTVAVNEDHRLPHPEDPLEDARSLVRALAGLQI